MPSIACTTRAPAPSSSRRDCGLRRRGPEPGPPTAGTLPPSWRWAAPSTNGRPCSAIPPGPAGELPPCRSCSWRWAPLSAAARRSSPCPGSRSAPTKTRSSAARSNRLRVARSAHRRHPRPRRYRASTWSTISSPRSPGPGSSPSSPGTYWLAAFEDANGDGKYDDEPALRPDPEKPVELAAGQHLQGIDLRIPLAGRFARGSFCSGRPPGPRLRRAAARQPLRPERGRQGDHARRSPFRPQARRRGDVEVLRLPARHPARHLLPSEVRPEKDSRPLRPRHRRHAARLHAPSSRRWIARASSHGSSTTLPGRASMQLATLLTQLFVRLRVRVQLRPRRGGRAQHGRAGHARSSCCRTTRPTGPRSCEPTSRSRRRSAAWPRRVRG